MNLRLFDIPFFDCPDKQGTSAERTHGFDDLLDVLINNKGDQIAGASVLIQGLDPIILIVFIGQEDVRSKNDYKKDETYENNIPAREYHSWR